MKKYDHRKISIHRSYSISEIASIFDIRERTVFNWMNNGLTPIEPHRKPLLFHGKTLKNYLIISKTKWPKMKSHEFPCLSCKLPRSAKEKSIRTIGNKKYGKCKVCGGNMCRFIKPP